jgi:hypothetical protein
MTRMGASWRALPSGHLVALSRTQELLLDMGPVVEDLVLVCVQLKCISMEAAQTRQEARELMVRSRRQRLGLRLLQRADTA